MTNQAARREQAKTLLEAANMIRARVMGSVTPPCAGPDGEGLALTQSQLALMHALRGRGESTVKELARVLQVSAPSVSAMVDRMVELGAVTREQSPRDRREVIVRPTDAASHAMDVIEDRMYDTIADLLHKLGPDDARKWREVFHRIRTILEEESAEPASSGGSGEKAP